MPSDDSLPAAPASRRKVPRRRLVGVLAFFGLVWLVLALMSWKLAILLGLGLTVFAGWLAWQQHTWLRAAQVVPGTVTELIRVTGSRGRSNYRPRIRYTTPDGTVHSFVRGDASGPAGLAVGEPLTVAYHDDRPQDLHVLTFGRFYGYAVFLAGLGILLMLTGVAFLVGGRYVPAIYLPGQPPVHR